MDGRVSEPESIVLYIAGDGRSGSTLLATILGNHEGFFPVGEIRAVWQALQRDELCGCGEPFSNCEFWRRVGEHAFGGWKQVDVDAMLAADRRFARHRSVPRLVALASRSAAANAELRELCRALELLYAAVREVSGCSVIVDTTKDPSYAFLLRRVPGLRLRYIHLVRDSRGVAYSWSKSEIELPEFARHPTMRFMPRLSSWVAALQWDVKNAAIHVLTPSAGRRRVRYESFVAAPARELTRILDLTDQARRGHEAVEPRHEFESLPFHSVEGNPMRFKRGPINLHLDDEWRREMRRSDRLVVTALTWPMLIAYGYVGKRMKTARSARSAKIREVPTGVVPR